MATSRKPGSFLKSNTLEGLYKTLLGANTNNVKLAADGEIEAEEVKIVLDPDLEIFKTPEAVKDKHIVEIGQWYLNKFCKKDKFHGNQELAQSLVAYKSPNDLARERMLMLGDVYIAAIAKSKGQLAQVCEKALMLGYGLTEKDFKLPRNELNWFIKAQINGQHAEMLERNQQDQTFNLEKSNPPRP